MKSWLYCFKPSLLEFISYTYFSCALALSESKKAVQTIKMQILLPENLLVKIFQIS